MRIRIFEREDKRKEEAGVISNGTSYKKIVEALAKATTHGEKFLVTGGKHYTHDAALKLSEIEAKNRDVKIMEEDRTKCLGQEKTEKEALAIIESELPTYAMTNTHFTKLLL